ncbi:hypothetical protein N7520_010638 [Penicillium odoratum]|uniref:uncharacterized protein n=1 Tax=Penicillium odoratum TaxID=1167516 RepID=UPI0025471A77|nr:uncharacterized protein N7520_010638 [Penicillium odoratum]KAJ5745456.1 hypothetical protein N7520_010638 [Penicillium odoratum]
MWRFAEDCNLLVVTELVQICHPAFNVVEDAIQQCAMVNYPPVVLANAQILSHLLQTVELVEPIAREPILHAAKAYVPTFLLIFLIVVVATAPPARE